MIMSKNVNDCYFLGNENYKALSQEYRNGAGVGDLVVLSIVRH